MIVRSEYFSEFRRLVVPSTRPLLGADVMVDRGEVLGEENFPRFERMRLSKADMCGGRMI